MPESKIVFDRLYMDLSQAELDKLSPMQLEDYSAKLQARKKEVLSDLEKEIDEAKRALDDVNDAFKDYWRGTIQRKSRNSEYSSGGRGGLSDLIQRRAVLAEVIVSLESQHDWLTGSKMD